MKPPVLIYTDGSCRVNTERRHIRGLGPGGWAYVILIGPRTTVNGSGGFKCTTTNRMEMYAALRALRELKHLRFKRLRQIEVRSDSSYLVNAFRQGWLRMWQRNGWINSLGEPVSNQDLWMDLFQESSYWVNLKWVHVKGHSGIEYNEKCDRLAKMQMAIFFQKVLTGR